MALIVCSECGKEFSDKAGACPQCGCPTVEVLKSINNFRNTDETGKEERPEEDKKRETLRDYLERVRALEMDCYTYDQIIENLTRSKITIPLRERPSVPILDRDKVRQQVIKEWVHAHATSYEKTLSHPEDFLFSESPIMSKSEYKKDYLKAVFEKGSLKYKAHFLKNATVNLDNSYEEYVRTLEYGNKEKRDRLRMVEEKVDSVFEKNNQILVDYEDYKKECERSNALNEKIDNQISEIKEERNASKTALQQLYELNIIFPKYRGLIPITMFCDYMDSGRRTVLEGVHGMYDLYEAELLGHQIVGELGQINSTLREIKAAIMNLSSQLSGIQRNQILLYKEVARGNDIASRICQNTGAIADNSKLLSSQMTEVSGELHRMNSELGGKIDAIHTSSEKTAYSLEAQTRRVDAIAKISEYEFALKQYPFFN